MLITLTQLRTSLQAVIEYIKKVLPTKTSDLENDSGFVTDSMLDGKVSFESGVGENSLYLPVDNESSPQNSSGVGSVSICGSSSGSYSFADSAGTASGNFSHADSEGTATGIGSHADSRGIASGTGSHANSYGTASGYASSASGLGSIANHKSQHAFGEYNIADPSSDTASNRGNYIEIVGKGTSDSARSNARTLDWNGNEVLAGKLTVGTAPTANMDVATKKYVDDNTGTLSISGNVITLTSGSATSSVTLPVYTGGVSS